MTAKRRVKSIKAQLLAKSREAALSAVQIFNNPIIQFKSESYIVLMVIAWTYLLHAFYRGNKIEYRHYEIKNGKRRFKRTKSDTYLCWELERCLQDNNSPVDKDTANNLLFLIGLRHEIEHQMSRSLDSYLTARYQACSLNYNHYIRSLFGERYGIEQHLIYSIQFAELSYEQFSTTPPDDISSGIMNYISRFDDDLSDDEFNNSRYAYRLIFERKLAGKKGQADKVIEFIKSDLEEAALIDKDKWVKHEVEKPKFLAGQVVRLMQREGFTKFTMHYHTLLWKETDGRNVGKGYGTYVANSWYWCQRWIGIVRSHCMENSLTYGNT